jgi:hypothetical protein
VTEAKVAENRYGKYFLREPWGLSTPGNQDPDQPVYIGIIGGNPIDFGDFGADVEFVMGEGDDAETHTSTSTTWVYGPKDLPHAPLNFKRVDRPIMFGHIMFAPGFASTTSFDPDPS